MSAANLALFRLFPELRKPLEDAFEQAEPGTVWIITRYRDGNQNLRTQLHRIIERAGLEPWPKPFQNLRSTRETELCNEFPSHVVCKWIGNSEAVAAKHYLQVTDEHFEKAIDSAAQKAAQKVSEIVRKSPSQETGKAHISGPFETLQYCTNKQVAEAGFEPARPITGTGF